jgi:hypothetical protein
MAWVMLAGLLCLGAIVVTAICAEGGATPATAPLADALDWQAALGLRQPWRLWTCAWVHWNAAHLLVNVAGGGVVAFVGWRARLPREAALAWLLAWPLTQLAMAALGAERVAAAMPHYGGLSGVLHAGAVVLGLSLAWPRARVRPRIAPSRANTGFDTARASAIEPSRITEGPWAMTEMGAHTLAPASASTLDPPMSGPPVALGRPLRERWIGVAIVLGTLAKVLLEAPWSLVPQPSAALGIAVAPVAHACGVLAGLLAWGGMRVLARRG